MLLPYALATLYLVAGTDIRDIEELSLDDLLDPKTATAAKTELKISENPGIMTVITREEIEASGAQYLMDLLQLVPGFQFGVDVEGVVGVGFRGLWGHEGKVLVLIDGLELNETLYGTTQFGQHIPLGIAERVEIIRGPGSAVYGGFAELAVINVITKGGKALRGASAQGYYGHWLPTTPGRGTLSLSGGNKWGDLDVSLNGSFGMGRRSDGIYRDLAGTEVAMRDQSGVLNAMVNLGLAWRGLRVRAVYDEYDLEFRTGFGEVTPALSRERFGSWLTEARYEATVRHNLRITPRLAYKYQQPWQIGDPSASDYYQHTAMRLHGGVTADWGIIEGLNLLGGLEGYWDHARVEGQPEVGLNLSFANATTVNYGNGIAFLQLVWLNRFVNVTGGVRGEIHSAFGPSFVPRLALTKTIDRFNFKLLYSQAFRAPVIENLNINPSLRPERTNVVEAEISVRFTPAQQLAVNGFFGRIDRTIVYGFDQAAMAEQYRNGGHTGSSGVEIEYQYKEAWAKLRLSYSFYTSDRQNTVETYSVANDPGMLLAFARHKVGLLTSFDLYKSHLWFDASGTFLSRRAGYVSLDTDGNPVLGSEPETLLLNLALRLRDLPVRGLELALGMLNVTGQRYRLLQPYNGGHAPLPLHGRELYLRARFDVNFL